MSYRAIEDPTKLRRVLEATLLIESNLELAQVLRHVVEEACSMTGARYGAIGVLDDAKQSLSDFVTVGISDRGGGGHRRAPDRDGACSGLLIADPQPLRIAEISDHAQSLGFPPATR